MEIGSEPERIPVYPFPETGRPDNFTGLADSVCLSLYPATPFAGQGGEMNLVLVAEGPGTPLIEDAPAISLVGPAELRVFESRAAPEHDGRRRTWDVVITPTGGDGQVVLGPDSIAWFDRDDLRFRQAVLSPCTLRVSRPERDGTPPVLPTGPETGRSQAVILTVVLASLALILALVAVAYVRRGRKWASGSKNALMQCPDIEDLLSCFEAALMRLLSGRPRYSGIDAIEGLLSAADVGKLLSRSIIRHWRDMEHALMGRAVGSHDLERLKRRSCDLVEMLEAALAGGERGDDAR